MGVKIKRNKTRFSEFKREVIGEVKQEFLLSANRIEAAYVSGVPVDTGALKNSIHTIEEFNGLKQSIGTNIEYAPYIEFGTGAMIDVPAGLESYALQFKGAGIKQVNLPARPALFPAGRLEITKLIAKLKKKK